MPAWASEIPLGPQNSTVALGGLVTLLTCLCIGSLVRLRRRNLISKDIQRYQWNTGVAGTPKKRWMWDSLQLLREGYSKVSPHTRCPIVLFIFRVRHHIHLGTLNLAFSNDWWPQFYGRPWQVWTSEGYQLVLPPAHLDELKMLPDHTFPSSLREVSVTNHSSAKDLGPAYPGTQVSNTDAPKHSSCYHNIPSNHLPLRSWIMSTMLSSMT